MLQKALYSHLNALLSLVWDVLWAVSFSDGQNRTAIIGSQDQKFAQHQTLHISELTCHMSSMLPTLFCAFVSECLVYKCEGSNCTICFEKYIENDFV